MNKIEIMYMGEFFSKELMNKAEVLNSEICKFNDALVALAKKREALTANVFVFKDGAAFLKECNSLKEDTVSMLFQTKQLISRKEKLYNASMVEKARSLEENIKQREKRVGFIRAEIRKLFPKGPESQANSAISDDPEMFELRGKHQKISEFEYTPFDRQPDENALADAEQGLLQEVSNCCGGVEIKQYVP